MPGSGIQCQYCRSEATHTCNTVMAYGMYVCRKHTCPDCNPIEVASEPPAEPPEDR